jgi:formate dehydrogenase subunit delta
MIGSDRLIQMANDIGNFFRAQPKREDAIAGIANHIRNFWTQRMREKLLASIAHGDAALDELPREAMRLLAERAPSLPPPPPGGGAG